MHSYDDAHRSGIETITWERFAQLARTLVEKLAPFNIEAVVGTARAGLFPATAVCLMLRRELYPARVSRRVNDDLCYRAGFSMSSSQFICKFKLALPCQIERRTIRLQRS